MTSAIRDVDELMMMDLRYVRARLDRLGEARLWGRLSRPEQEEYDLLCQAEQRLNGRRSGAVL
jgi:hypothetical protein